MSQNERVAHLVATIEGLFTQLKAELNKQGVEPALITKGERSKFEFQIGRLKFERQNRIQVFMNLIEHLCKETTSTTLKQWFSKEKYPGSYELLLTREEYNKLPLKDKHIRYIPVKTPTRDAKILYAWKNWGDYVTKKGVKIEGNFPKLMRFIENRSGYKLIPSEK